MRYSLKVHNKYREAWKKDGLIPGQTNDKVVFSEKNDKVKNVLMMLFRNYSS